MDREYDDLSSMVMINQVTTQALNNFLRTEETMESSVSSSSEGESDSADSTEEEPTSSSPGDVKEPEVLSAPSWRKPTGESGLTRLDRLKGPGLLRNSRSRTLKSPTEEEAAKHIETTLMEYKRVIISGSLDLNSLASQPEDKDQEQELSALVEKRDRLMLDLDTLMVAQKDLTEQQTSHVESLKDVFDQLQPLIRLLTVDCLAASQQMLEGFTRDYSGDGVPRKTQISTICETFRALIRALEEILQMHAPIRNFDRLIRNRKVIVAQQIGELQQKKKETEISLISLQKSTQLVNSYADPAKRILGYLQELVDEGSDNMTKRIRTGYKEGPLAKLMKEADELPADSGNDRRSTVGSVTLGFSEEGSLVQCSIDDVIVLITRMFINPVELLQRLILSYCKTAHPSMPLEKQKTLEEKELIPARFRVLNFLKLWLKVHPYDFTESKVLHNTLKNFLTDIVVPTYATLAKRLLAGITGTTGSVITRHDDRPKMLTQEFNDFVDIDPMELARQITLKDSELYNILEVRDLLKCAWSDKSNQENTVRMLIGRFNKTAAFCRGVILTEPDVAKRAATIMLLISTCSALRSIGNFLGVVALVGGLGSSSVARLKKTWELVAPASMQKLREYQDLLKHNFSQLRNDMQLVSAPTIPYVGCFLTDLTYISEMKEPQIPLINVRKMLLSGRAIERIVGKRSITTHKFHAVYSIQELITSKGQLHMDENACYKVSRTLENDKRDSAKRSSQIRKPTPAKRLSGDKDGASDNVKSADSTRLTGDLAQKKSPRIPVRSFGSKKDDASDNVRSGDIAQKKSPRIRSKGSKKKKSFGRTAGKSYNDKK